MKLAMQVAPTVWSRRQCLGALATIGMGSLISPRTLAATPETAWYSSYAPLDDPAFKGSLYADGLPVEGQLPPELRGTLYRNGPARFSKGSSRLTHWFDGDGMLQALRIDGGRVSHHGRLLVTPKVAQEDAAGRFLYGGFGSSVDSPQSWSLPDTINPANINLLIMDQGRKLYALWEAGSALQVAPDTLIGQGFKVWSPETAGAPFSAHPRIASDGTVWNFGYMPGSGKLLIYQISSNGQLKRQTVLDVPNADLVHDFAITERHLVFLLQPLKFERSTNQPNLLAGMNWDSHAPMIACVVAMADWSKTLIELPNSGTFHLGNAYERGDSIYLSYVHHHNILHTMRSFDVSPSASHSTLLDTVWTHVELQASRRNSLVQSTDLRQVEFPRFDSRRIGQRQQLTVMLQRSPVLSKHSVLGFNTVLSTDGETIQKYDYGEGWLAEEHIYVPHPHKSAEKEGWILGTAYHWPTEKTTLSVFGAGQISAGPVARVQLPYGLPLGLHGQFAPTRT